MKIMNLVDEKATTIGADVILRNAARLMARTQHHALGVVRNGNFVGLLTDHDITIAIADGVDVEIAEVQDWMTPVPDVVSADTAVGEALKWMVDGNYRHLPLIDESGNLLAILSMRDLVGRVMATSF